MKYYAILYSLLLVSIFQSCKPDDVKIIVPEAPPANKAILTFKFNSLYNNSPIDWSSFNKTMAGDTIKFSKIKYIFSNFILEKTNGDLVKIADAYGFVSITQGVDSFEIKYVPKGEYKSIKMEVGLDSAINHGNPTQWAKINQNHPLNPSVNDMFWGWSGGYIFNVVEGNYKNNGSDNTFSFHVALDKNVRNHLFNYNYNISKNARFTFNVNTDKIFSDVINFSLKTDGSFSHSADPDPTMDKFLQNAGSVITIKDFK